MSKKIYFFTPIFLILLVFISLFNSLITTSESISDKVFRLHIIANSDSREDQELKLLVRDEILSKASYFFTNSNSLNEIINIISENINTIETIAKDIIAEQGYNYNIKVQVDEEYFNTRKYSNFILPAGKYNCLKVIIGEGIGHNWWCVMYPSVCISGCTDDFNSILNENEKDLILDNKYIAKFKIIELYEEIKNKIIS